MAAPLGREPYGKAEARAQAAEVYEDSTATPSRSLVPARVVCRVPEWRWPVRGFPPATRSRNPGLDLLQTVVHVKR